MKLLLLFMNFLLLFRYSPLGIPTFLTLLAPLLLIEISGNSIGDEGCANLSKWLVALVNLISLDLDLKLIKKKTYEYKRGQYIKTILDQATASLDIHSTLNKSKPFIIVGFKFLYNFN